MSRRSTLISRLLLIGSGAFALGALVALVVLVLPLPALESLSKQYSSRLQVVLFLSCFGSFMGYFLSRLWDCEASLHKDSKPASLPPKWLVAVQCLITLFIVGRSAYDVVHAPLDSDEVYLSSQIGEGKWAKAINPIGQHRNHSVAMAASYLSQKLFGLNEVTIRYPAVIFTAVFLIVLNLLCWRIASPFTSVLVSVHLLFNQTVIWFMHSNRGYISMMLFAVATLLVIFSHGRERQLGTKFLFGFLFIGLMASHTFGAIFALMILCTLILWTYFNRTLIDKDRFSFHKGLIGVGLGLLPLMAIVLLSSVKDVSAYGYLNANYSDDYATEILRLVGIGEPNWAIAFFGLVAVCLGLRISRKELLSDFWTLFLVLSTCFLTGLFIVLKPNILEGRMFLAFLVPLLMWIGATLKRCPKPFRPGFASFALGVLVIAVIPNEPDIFNIRAEIHGGFKDFAVQVRDKLPKNQNTCLTFSGLPHQVYWAENLYFFENRPDSKKECTDEFHVNFSYTILELQEFEKAYQSRYVRTYLDPELRTLYQVTN